MDVNVARDVDAAGHVAGVMRAHGFELRGDSGHVAIKPDGIHAPDGEPLRSAAMPIGFGKVRKWVLRTPLSLRTRMTLPAW